MPQFRMIMLSRALPGREADYEAWYDQTHIPEMLQLPGVEAAQRFRVTKNIAGKTDYPYCTVYEMDAASPDVVLGTMFGAMQSGKMTMSDTVDPTDAQGFIIEPLGERVTAG